MSTVYIEIDELAVNALVAAQKYGRNFVSYKLMEDYGFRVVRSEEHTSELQSLSC